ncbi:MAG: Adenylosuccinate lyase [Bacteroidetes bacterium ADurb.Bin408]|nr:MAG: Adenylosuccinate lyase [Bacteroidetes bacterium ADurb.Bin408]
MSLTPLTAISPVDGRYNKATAELQPFFSEYALIRYRVFVEIEYFIALCRLPLPGFIPPDKNTIERIREIYADFSEKDALIIKEIEAVTNHDVKAVEYYLKKAFEQAGLEKYKEFIHFALTSQDINNTAQPLMLKDALQLVIIPFFESLIETIQYLSIQWKNISMPAYTHGQPASPTTMGKEIRVFAERLQIQLTQLKSIPVPAKFGGATGNFNAHCAAYPGIDWIAFADDFVNKTLQLNRSRVTTQIEHYDNLAAIFDAVKRLNTILIDMSRDIWSYISMNYFSLAVKKGEVGSSAMPHKVNPIDFENAEGNLGLANALLEHLSAKLPVSRLQRDLTDSTVLRNTGVPLAHTLIALKSLSKGLAKLSLNETVVSRDLDANWAVVAEAIQTVLRSIAYPEPYEKLKELTRTGHKITQKQMHAFIDSLDVNKKMKTYLKKITPSNYTGLASQMVR